MNVVTHAVAESLPPAHGCQVPARLTLQDAEDLTLYEHREAFVEPEVPPLAVGNQVAGPAVGYLMDHNVHS